MASVSHELRTPLAQIRMFTETLQLGRERNAEERQAWLNIIGREARRLGDLVENILLFSHIDADRAKLELERTDLGELIEEVVEGYVPLAEQRGMRIWPMRRRASSRWSTPGPCVR
ncbi:MAG: HAMP domain-containing histidine kinase [Gemmatimonadetes bacterium]|nr:HAMP domain-containing histidine kinase [Gemmatimonadota bacterium]